jgi:hypothetical protein
MCAGYAKVRRLKMENKQQLKELMKSKGIPWSRKLAEKLYRQLARKYHPDQPGGDTQKMQELNALRDKHHAK